jgi:hypothetical protein
MFKVAKMMSDFKAAAVKPCGREGVNVLTPPCSYVSFCELSGIGSTRAKPFATNLWRVELTRPLAIGRNLYFK